MNKERERLLANVSGPHGWKHWGPYLSERQWGTVREDYSADGTACAKAHLVHGHEQQEDQAVRHQHELRHVAHLEQGGLWLRRVIRVPVPEGPIGRLRRLGGSRRMWDERVRV